MRVLIIEDESTAVEKLKTMLFELDKSVEIVGITESVKETLLWLSSNPSPDLAFVDVQLSDDSSFEIFKAVDIKFPIIFTTAYDDYILKAFEFNSIDYLLKPLQMDRLKKALGKVKKLETHFWQYKFNELFEQTGSKAGKKQRYVVKKGVDFVSVNVSDIAYIFTEYRVVFLKDKEGNKYIIDKTLTDLQEELDTGQFFRANRKFLINIDAVEKFKSDNGKIVIDLRPEIKEEVVVSKENAPNFRNWIGG